MDLVLEDGTVILESEIRAEFSRSSGPGGQHVNKTETRVTLRWSLERSALEPGRKARLRLALGHRLTKEGELLVSVDTTRSQARNLELAYARMRDIISPALRRPERRRATRPSRGAKERRLRAKREHGEKKAMRKRPSWD